jgi:alkylation response protein AidB-like acyl-CoA dehydrogenase
MIARARAIIPMLRERAPHGERERRLPIETIADMQAAGLFKVLQPRRWGGYELDILTYYEIQMALGEGDMSVAWVYGVVGVHPWFVALLDDRAAKDIWGKDDNTLICSSLMPSGVAKPADGGFRISGRWKYASGCEHCEWAFLGGAVEGKPDDRQPRYRDRGCVCAGIPDPEIFRQFARLRAGPGAEHLTALPAAGGAGVSARRVDRRDRRAAGDARCLSRLRQEAHRPKHRHARVGGCGGAIALC